MESSVLKGKFARKVLTTIRKYELIAPGDTILAGISGGPDSVVLLFFLHLLSREWNFSFHPAHLDHGLRGEESQLDADFVEDLCTHLGLSCIEERCNVRHLAEEESLSLEEAARKARYDFFFRHAKNLGVSRIAVGHNMDDQAETVLMHLFQGTGLAGLSGMRPLQGKIIRPFLEVTRMEILQFCEEHKLQFREDPSNRYLSYLRNRLRHEIIPEIEKFFNPRLRETLARQTMILRSEDDLIQEQSREIFSKTGVFSQDSVAIPLEVLRSLHPALRRRLIRFAIEKIKHDLKDISWEHTEAILGLQRVGSRVALPGGFQARLDYTSLHLERPRRARGIPPPIPLIIPGENTIPEWGLKIKGTELQGTSDYKLHDPYCANLDREELTGSFFIRSRIAGDRFHPFGSCGGKKLHDFFIDEKIPRDERDRVPLLICGEDIVWVIGYRIDDRFKVAPKTSRRLLIEARRL